MCHKTIVVRVTIKSWLHLTGSWNRNAGNVTRYWFLQMVTITKHVILYRSPIMCIRQAISNWQKKSLTINFYFYFPTVSSLVAPSAWQHFLQSSSRAPRLNSFSSRHELQRRLEEKPSSRQFPPSPIQGARDRQKNKRTPETQESFQPAISHVFVLRVEYIFLRTCTMYHVVCALCHVIYLSLRDQANVVHHGKL